MPYAKLTQGQSRTKKFNIDLSSITGFDSVEIELTQSDSTVIKWKTPDTEGFEKITVEGGLHWFDITSVQSSNLQGPYNLEFAVFNNGNSEEKSIVKNFLYVEKESK